jgi:hypothetical protein
MAKRPASDAASDKAAKLNARFTSAIGSVASTDRTDQSAPFMKLKITIHTRDAQLHMADHFPHVAKSLRALALFLPGQVPDDDARLIEDNVATRFATAEEALSEKRAAAAKLVDEDETLQTPEYTHPATATLRYDSPLLRRYAELCCEFDRCLHVVDSIWMAGRLSNVDYKKLKRAFIQVMSDLAGAVSGMRGDAFRSAKQSGNSALVENVAAIMGGSDIAETDGAAEVDDNDNGKVEDTTDA